MLAPDSPAPTVRRRWAFVGVALAAALVGSGLTYVLTRSQQAEAPWIESGLTLTGTGAAHAPYAMPAGATRLVLDFTFDWAWAETTTTIQGFSVGVQQGDGYGATTGCWAIFTRWDDGTFGVSAALSVDGSGAGPGVNPSVISAGTHRMRLELQQDGPDVAITGYLDGVTIGTAPKPATVLATLPLSHLQASYFSDEPNTKVEVTDLAVWAG